MKGTRRIALWFAGILLVVVAGVALAFRFSPWPSVAVIKYLFAKSGQAADARLARHVPKGIIAQRDIAYGDGTDEKLDIYYESGARAAQPAIIWVHGGAWVAGSKEGISNYLKILAGRGYRTVAVEYSTGYGSKYPKPVEQVNAALGYLTRNAVVLRMDSKHFILAGDSAGAQIMSQVAVIATNPGYAAQMQIVPTLKHDQVTAILLLSGAYDLNSFDFHGDYAWLLNPVFWAYSGSRNFLDDERFRLLSVVDHVTKDFPPAFISSGNGDPLAPQAVALAQKLKSLGVPTQQLFFSADQSPALPHEYQFNLDTRAGQEALSAMLAFIESRLRREPQSKSRHP